MEDSGIKNPPKVLILPKRKVIVLTEPPAAVLTPKNSGESPEKSKLIDLGDKAAKMALHRRFNVDVDGGTEHSCGDVHYCVRMTETSGKNFFVPKLPQATVLVKQDNKTLQKSMENSIHSLRKRLTQQINGQGPKRIIQPERNKNSQVRRNPSRLSKKKIDEEYPRPRLLALKRRGCDGNSPEKRLKLSDVPYMNTRSVTKRLYNVGATLQVPNIQEDFEWKEWPTHGMHERPIYHPQVGPATEIIGRCFTSFDGKSYQEIPNNPDLEIPPPPSGKRKIPDLLKIDGKLDISFEDCMHLTFHSVLSYAAGIMTPEYQKIEEKIASSKPPTISIKSESKKPSPEEKTPEIPQASSAPEVKPKPPKPQLNLMCIKNHAKLQEVLGRGKKNTLILLKTSDPNPKKDSSVFPPQSETSQRIQIPKSPENKAQMSVKIEEKKIDWEKETKEKEKSLKELIADTAVLYCTSMGVHQDDLINYVDSLNFKECRNSMGTEY
uniref:DBT protein n=1 Tax=Fopius arisanus TaxID=64838 RepID=A0A0C9Q1L4_9HYME